uniref:Putative amino-acid permease n=1 Tax=Aegilops tauschii TaxID=37682 RepID=R7W6F3_AEGTA
MAVAISVARADRARMHQLGYKQELKRGLSVVSNFEFSFSLISVLTGVTSTNNTGLRSGVPASMTLGWLVVASFNGCVALSMAEICSAYPTSGGLYYWSAKLAGGKWASLASWVTGWFNIVGQWASTTSVDFSLAQLLQVIILLGTGGAQGGGYRASKYVVLAIYGFILVLHGLINSLPIHWLSWFGKFGAFWNAAGVFVLAILIPAVANERASVEFIFTQFNTDNGMGVHGKALHSSCGVVDEPILCHWLYDTSAHMTEETKNADRSGPIGIITSVSLATIIRWVYLVALTSIVTDIPYLLSADNDAGSYAIAQALYNTFHQRYGRGVGGLACLGVVAIAMFLCGVACITSNSRMGYAFSRDGAMPYSHMWYQVSKPLNVVWLSIVVAFTMALTVFAGESCGVPGDVVDRDAGVVYLLGVAHLLPCDHGPEVIHLGAVSSWQWDASACGKIEDEALKAIMEEEMATTMGEKRMPNKVLVRKGGPSMVIFVTSDL